MPHLFHQNARCAPGRWSGSPEICQCPELRHVTRWMLAKHERMLRYQLYYGIKPITEDRAKAQALFDDVVRRCERCESEGLLAADDDLPSEQADGTPVALPYRICPDCQGFGNLPLPDDPAVQVIRARVARQHRKAAARTTTADVVAYLRHVLESGSPLIHDLRRGTIVDAGR